MNTSKREMATFITGELLDQRMKLTNWEVKVLMNANQAIVEELYEKAQKVMNAKADLEILWDEILKKCTPSFLAEIDAPGDW